VARQRAGGAYGADTEVGVEQDAGRERRECAHDVDLEGGEIRVGRRFAGGVEHSSERRALVHGEDREAPVRVGDGVERRADQRESFLPSDGTTMTALSELAGDTNPLRVQVSRPGALCSSHAQGRREWQLG
jgi:hypothetical protein